MSTLTVSLARMQQVNENALLALFDQEGIRVVEKDLPEGMWGAYDQAEKRVYIQRGMPYLWRVATLYHELLHVLNAHDGHQCQAVEDRINGAVAVAMVDPVDYAFYETQFGWSTGGIAHELGLPRWVIEAYRRVLIRSFGVVPQQ